MDMEFVYCLLQSINLHTLNMDYIEFGSLVCMLAEDYCKANSLNVIEFMKEMNSMVTQVNEELGEY